MNPGTNIKEKGRPTIHFGMIQIITGLILLALTINIRNDIAAISGSYLLAVYGVAVLCVIWGVKSFYKAQNS